MTGPVAGPHGSTGPAGPGPAGRQGAGPGAEAAARAAPGPADGGKDLRDVAAQLEGVFIRQLFKAMRETVPEGGALETGAGTEMFRDLMDEHLADEMAGRLRTGVGEAVYRQIRSGERAAPAEPGRGREGPR